MNSLDRLKEQAGDIKEKSWKNYINVNFWIASYAFLWIISWENEIESTSLHNTISASRHRENKDQFIYLENIYFDNGRRVAFFEKFDNDRTVAFFEKIAVGVKFSSNVRAQ